ncbi:MAG TPA: Gx transporter family protein, partial [Candidatus Avoscillospira avistercoris]|nr:Gx transporter family protein [Candidatus Avoscillospira avistercoris]
GGLLALLVMAALKRCKRLSLYGISMAGAAAHNIGQLSVAALVLGSSYVWAYLPFLLLVSLATGTITGTVAAYGFRGLLGAGLRMR